MADTTADTTGILFTPSPSGSRGEWGGSRRETSGTPAPGPPTSAYVEDVEMDAEDRSKSGARAAGMGMGYRGDAGYPEESVRIDYVDPAAERETRRMMEAFRRQDREKSRRS